MNNQNQSKYLDKRISTPIGIVIIVLVAIIAGAGILAWQHWWIPGEKIEVSNGFIEQDGAKEKLTMNKIKNAEYGTCWNSKINQVKFTNGFYVEPPLNSEWATVGWSINIVEDKVAFGDLDGDGKDDAALILKSYGGGSGSFYEIVVLLNDNGKPLYFGCEQLGDRVKINSVNIQFGNIIIDIITHGSNDGLCCPTVRKIIQYKLSGDKLVEVVADETLN